MPSADIQIGEYASFIEGVEAAVLTGNDIALARVRLANRPPFRNPREVGRLAF